MNYKKFLVAASVALMIVIILTLVLAPKAWAQNKFKTLHTFKREGGKDGGLAMAGLVSDKAGNLYGMAQDGGTGDCRFGCGVVFRVTPNSDGTWTESVLHSFNRSDGEGPMAGLIFDAAGSLYGTTTYGGTPDGEGTVFKLSPNADGSWTESVLYSFGSDTRYPRAGLTLDQDGNLYGTVSDVGANGEGGGVFKLMPNANGGWTESTLYSFCSLMHCSDGSTPVAGLIFDPAGNLYGTTEGGGAYGYGVVFRLAPKPDGTWEEKVLHQFARTGGGGPAADLIFDRAGNLYGTTVGGGNSVCVRGCGVVFQLAPNTDGSWKEKVLHRFSRTDGEGPYASLIFDAAGNLYGTTFAGGNLSYCADGCGVVFRLTPNSNGRWHETVLHTFRDHPGAYPSAGVILDAQGNLYGTTLGDINGDIPTFGSVFEITP